MTKSDLQERFAGRATAVHASASCPKCGTAARTTSPDPLFCPSCKHVIATWTEDSVTFAPGASSRPVTIWSD